VRGKITDKDGGVNEYSATVTVNNVPPSVGPIAAPTAPVQIGAVVGTSAAFTDPGVLDTHTAVWDWGDGSTSAGIVTEAGGSGSVTGSHTYSTPGVFTLTLTVTDKDGGSGQATFSSITVNGTNHGSVSGDGWINSPAGAYPANPTLKGRATFDFDVSYRRGATLPSGSVEFNLKYGVLDFHSTSLDWMTIDTQSGWFCRIFNRCPSTIQIKGTGKLRGGGTYQFMIWATSAHPDTFRIKIWNVGPGGVENVLYDNLTPLPLGGGSIDVLR
jgi:hypothetical protein